MITPARQTEIEAHAYVPEHLPAYVSAISSSEPEWLDGYLVYRRGDALIFIGYPLDGEMNPSRLLRALEKCRAICRPRLLSLEAPDLPPGSDLGGAGGVSRDCYYRLDLAGLHPSKKLRSLLKRAGRELRVASLQTWRRDHQRLVDAFVRSRRLDRETRFIFKRIPEYVRAGSAWIFEARDQDEKLVALDIADFSAGDYAFYMFNFCARKGYVPGASDLLLWGVIERARQEGKRYLNLGLGINPGVTFFKTKWGAEAFLPHCACVFDFSEEDAIDSLVDALLK